MSKNVWKLYMVVIPTPFVITLWVPTSLHADQNLLETEETAVHVQVRLKITLFVETLLEG